jgi:hypothetical protein
MSGEDMTELSCPDLAGELESFGAAAEPAARSFAGAEVVLFGARGDGVEVVVRAPGAELADAQHGDDRRTDCSARARWGTDGASASLRIGRSTGRSVVVMTRR